MRQAMPFVEDKKQHNMFFRPKDLLRRIGTSFLPIKRYSNIDLLGPCISIMFLILLVHYGHTYKLPSAAVTISPLYAVLSYASTMPLLTYVLVRLGQGCISMLEAVTLIGYGLFGHVITVIVSLALGTEKSNIVFFCCLAVFGGSSALHVAISLLLAIPRPAARLVVCSVVATLQILSLIFVHFVYMHRTFVYGHHA